MFTHQTVVVLLLFAIVLETAFIAIMTRQAINKARSEVSETAIATKVAISDVANRLNNVELWLGNLVNQREADLHHRGITHANATIVGDDGAGPPSCGGSRPT